MSVFQDGPRKPSSPHSLGWAGRGSAAGPSAAEAEEKQSQLNAAGLAGFWEQAVESGGLLGQAGGWVGSAFKLCQLTSEAFLS